MKRLTATLIMMVGMCAALFFGAAASAGAQSTGSTCPVYPISQCSSGGNINVQGNITPLSNTTPLSKTTPAQLNTAGSINAVNGSTAPATASSSSGLSSSLAFTGTDAIGMVVIALLLIGGGALVVRASRRSPAI